MKFFDQEKRAVVKLVSPCTSSSLYWMVLILGLDCSISIKDMESHTACFNTVHFYIFPEFRAHALSMNIPSQSGGDNNAVTSAFSDKICHPPRLVHFLISQKEPNLHRSCPVAGDGILMLFNVPFTIQVFALVFLPPFFFLRII
jgi:hypothetical protein